MIDWGDVATWFTGLLTAGTLLLGFVILLGDRRRERRAQAARIVIWTTHHSKVVGGKVESHRKLYLLNKSDEPIFKPGTHQGRRRKAGVASFFWTDESPSAIVQLVEPGQQLMKLMPAGRDVGDDYPYLVDFVDANGVRWLRDAVFRDLIRVTALVRWRYKLFEGSHG